MMGCKKGEYIYLHFPERIWEPASGGGWYSRPTTPEDIKWREAQDRAAFDLHLANKERREQ